MIVADPAEGYRHKGYAIMMVQKQILVQSW
jgi:hypothetical protein